MPGKIVSSPGGNISSEYIRPPSLDKFMANYPSVFRDPKWNFSDNVLVATPSDQLFSKECIFKKECTKGTGLNYEMFSYFAQLLGLNTTVIKAKTYKYQDEKGAWHGVLGMIDRGEIDGAATLMYMENGRELDVADFTLPVGISYGGFVFRRPEAKIRNKLWNFYYVLDTEVWICLLACALALGLIHFVHSMFIRPLHPDSKTNLGILSSMSALSLIFLNINYQSNLITQYMIQPKLVYPFTNFEELADALESGEYSMVTHKYTRSFLYTVNTSSYPAFRRIRRSFDHNPLVLRKGRSAAIRAVREDPRLVYFASSKLTFQLVASKICDLTFLSDPLPRYLVFAFRKKSRYADLFNRIMYPFSFSAQDFKFNIEKRYVQTRTCNREDLGQKLVEGQSPIFLRLILGAFVILVSGLVAGSALLFFEYVLLWQVTCLSRETFGW